MITANSKGVGMPDFGSDYIVSARSMLRWRELLLPGL